MRSGHPYRTEELAQTRSEQRRILRSIPDWIVANTRLNRPGPRLADPDDALVERELRRLADRELEPLRCWLGVWRLHTETEMLGWWFAQAEIGAALEGVAAAVHEAHEAWRVAAYPSGLYPAILPRRRPARVGRRPGRRLHGPAALAPAHGVAEPAGAAANHARPPGAAQGRGLLGRAAASLDSATALTGDRRELLPRRRRVRPVGITPGRPARRSPSRRSTAPIPAGHRDPPRPRW